MNISEDQKRRLNKHVEVFLRQEGVLKEGSVSGVEFHVLLKVSTSTIEGGQYENSDSLSKVTSQMPQNADRLRNCLNNADIKTLTQLTALSLEHLLKCRNLGWKTIQDLGVALEKIGLSQTLLGNDIKEAIQRRDAKKSVLTEVRNLTEEDWLVMGASLVGRPMAHNKQHGVFMTNMKARNNALTAASKLFGSSVHPSQFIPVITYMNMRWINDKLPYRITHLKKPNLNCKYECLLQIAVIQ
jgi:hypothetical protein